jgi:predicted metalloprotease with PDZ domain
MPLKILYLQIRMLYVKKFALIVCLVIGTNAYADILYHIKHHGKTLHVTANFGKISPYIAAAPQNQTTKIELYVPSEIWGIDYSKQIRNIKVKNAKYDAVNHTVSLRDGMDLVIEYDVVNVEIDEFFDTFTDKYYHFIADDKFFFFGMGFFIYPVNYDQNYSKRVVIKISSKSKIIASNIAPYLHKNKIITNFSKLHTALMLASNSLNYSQDLTNKLTTIIWIGTSDLTNRINNILDQTLPRHKRFWQDGDFNQVAIFLPNPFKEKRNRYGGTVLNDSIAFLINPDTNDDTDLRNLINHEGLHFWFGGNGLINGPTWFTEGFTEYYMDKIDYTNSSRHELTQRYRQKLKTYLASPLHKLKDKELQKLFFNDKEAQKIPYLKGYLIAYQLDSIIDLDKALRSMIHKCRKHIQLGKKKCRFDADLLINNAKNVSQKKQKNIYKLINDFQPK